MTYWLMLSTLFYAHAYGVYPNRHECREAARQGAAWYHTARCVPAPKPAAPPAPR